MTRRPWLAAAIIGLLPTIALGQIGWNKSSKMALLPKFRDGNWEMFRQTVRHTAEVLPDGQAVNWSNSATSAEGLVAVVKRCDLPEVGACRDLHDRSNAGGRSSPFSITLCRVPSGDWRIKAN